MKEKIYTIPVNEAFDQNCECPLCYLKTKLEAEAVEYALGAAMMEPDYRIVSNEKGYCNHHYTRLFEKPNKLSLALVMDTHLEEVRKKLDSMSEIFEFEKSTKKGLFGKISGSYYEKINEKLTAITSSCVICDKMKHTLSKFTEVIFYLWEKESEFRKKLLASKGFCLPHFNELIAASFKYLNTKKACEFSGLIYELEKKELERIQNDIHNFTLKFDYRNKDSKWGTEIDAPVRSVEKVSGEIHKS